MLVVWPILFSFGLSTVNDCWSHQVELYDLEGLFGFGDFLEGDFLQGGSYLANGKPFELLGIPYLVGKIKFKLFFQGPLAK